MEKKTAVYLSLALTLAFLLALLVSLLCFSPGASARAVYRPAPAGELLTGRDDNGSAALELLPGELIDINTASEEELQKLPGIGEALAGAIAEYRAASGGFDSIEDIMNVPGIGEGRFADIAGNITVGEKTA